MSTSDLKDLKPIDMYVRLVRQFISDFVSKNNITEDEQEFEDKQIAQSVIMALEIFNSCVGHLTKHHIDKFPVPTLLVLGGAGYTMFMGGVLQARNHFSVSDGNTSGPVSEKTDLYRAWGQELVNNFITLSAKHKEAANMEQAYKSFGSNYLMTYFRENGIIVD